MAERRGIGSSHRARAYLPATVVAVDPRKTRCSKWIQNGVTTAIVSISTPGIWFGGTYRQARTLARRCNEYSARLVREPSRTVFCFFAAVASARHGRQALRERSAYAPGRAQGGRHWADDQLRRISGPATLPITPVFEELKPPKGPVVYIHPTGAETAVVSLVPHVPYVMTELPHDTTRAVTSLLFSGLVRAVPGHTLHLFRTQGGTLPMLAGRIARQGSGR